MSVNNTRIVVSTAATLSLCIVILRSRELEPWFAALLIEVLVTGAIIITWAQIKRSPVIDTNDALYMSEYKWLVDYLLELDLMKLDVTIELPRWIDNETVSVTRLSPVKYEIEVIVAERMYNYNTGEYDDFTTEWRYELSIRGRSRQVLTRCEVYTLANVEHTGESADRPRPIENRVPSLFYASWMELRELSQRLPPLETMQ